ncbi:NUDIX hydrolase [Hymenobacter sp. BT491]|uniref:NUDIX hydrolase n=1 Tax=Hymenobacter sp. BT491 TaxID=2766779 RepID=UPI0016536A49|nr:NUDIX domain-containing protein [Hymenobacter sp. BT491]MBC6991908.1 NUDIX domain-containing protein [Hymenobacter sp. BT491]
MKVIDKIAWLHLHDGKLLSTRSRGKDRYYIPGGKREAGESDEQTLRREIREELTVELTTGSLCYEGTFRAQAHGHAEGTLVMMTCYSARYEGILQPAAEIEEVVWLTYRDRPAVSAVDQVIFDWLHERQLLLA